MFERFTDRARRVVVLAQENARLLNHNYIGTEHLLLGLMQEQGGVAVQALESFGLSRDSVYQQVEEIIGIGKQPPSGHIPFTPRAKRVLELSLRESQMFGHSGIDDYHILLGLIREERGVAAKTLAKFGVDAVSVRARIVELVGTTEPDRPASESKFEPLDEPLTGFLTEPTSERGPGGPEQGEPGRDQVASATPLGRLRGLLTGGTRASAEPAPATARRVATRASRSLDWERPPGLNLTERARQGQLDPVTGREELAGRLLETLCRRGRNNALLVGESGVGKSALIGGLAQAVGGHQVPVRLVRADVWQVEHVAMWTARVRAMAGSQVGNVVLVVEDLDLLFAADATGTGFAAATLYSMCKSPVPVIASITPAGFRALTADQPLLADRFQEIEVPAADAAETVAVLTVLRETYEQFHGVTITDEAIAAAPALAAECYPNRALPGAAVDLIDAAGARLHVARIGDVAGDPTAGDQTTGPDTSGESVADAKPETPAAIVDEQLLISIAREAPASK